MNTCELIEKRLSDGSIVYNIQCQDDDGAWFTLFCQDKKHAERLMKELEKCTGAEVDGAAGW
jgi:hypothetical protein